MDGGGKVDPNSGIPGTCDAAADHLYDGVRGGNDYYEPNSSNTPGADERGRPRLLARPGRERARGAAVELRARLPRPVRGHEQAVQRDRAWRAVVQRLRQPRRAAPGKRAAQPCLRAGRDRLHEGRATSTPTHSRRSRRSLPMASRPPIRRRSTSSRSAAKRPPPRARRTSRTTRAPSTCPATCAGARSRRASGCSSTVRRAAPRCATASPRPTSQNGMGYYSFKPRPGLRFVVLDTIAENGGDGGNVDHTQFNWLHGELSDAEAKRELVLVFAHHSLETMNQAPLSIFGVGDQGGDQSPLVHFGMGPASGMTRPARSATRHCRRRPTRRCAACSCATRAWSRTSTDTSTTTASTRSSARTARARRSAASGRSTPRPTSTGRSSRARSTSSTTATATCRCSAPRSTRAARRTPAAPRRPATARVSRRRPSSRLASISRELVLQRPGCAQR